MIKLVTIIGARPQIIKASAFSRAVSLSKANVEEIIVHTGQHYDENMSKVFFEEMQIPAPNYNLEVGSGSHGEQTAKMLVGLEGVLLQEKPNAVVVFGDTNSTLAAALAASKLHIPVAHIEAGLRSYNKKMPEEINRVLTDHCSTWLFLPTSDAEQNLTKEGFTSSNSADIDQPQVVLSGDLMLDNAIHFSKELLPSRKNNLLFTCHRPSNTDEYEVFKGIVRAVQLEAVKQQLKVIWPVHPRVQKWVPALKKDIPNLEEYFDIVGPMSYLEMLESELSSILVVTDSGGVQKEAFFAKTPCVVLRNETEWVELVQNGNSVLTGSNPEKIKKGINKMVGKKDALTYPEFYGNGHAAEKMLECILASF